MSEPVRAAPARSRRRPRAWRDGGSSVGGWGADLLGWSVFSLGVGTLGARAGAVLLPAALAPFVCQGVLWAAFVVPSVWAFRRSRPRGLLRLRGTDLLIGVVWGIVLRFAQGALARAAGESAWPAPVDLASSSLVTEAILATTIAPVLEETFFHGVLLVSLYTVVRRLSGRVAAAIAALAVTTVLFVAAHGLVAPMGPTDTASLALVGAAAGACVLATGRLWPAVLVHAVYNLTGIAVVVVASVAA